MFVYYTTDSKNNIITYHLINPSLLSLLCPPPTHASFSRNRDLTLSLCLFLQCTHTLPNLVAIGNLSQQSINFTLF